MNIEHKKRDLFFRSINMADELTNNFFGLQELLKVNKLRVRKKIIIIPSKYHIRGTQACPKIALNNHNTN